MYIREYRKVNAIDIKAALDDEDGLTSANLAEIFNSTIAGLNLLEELVVNYRMNFNPFTVSFGLKEVDLEDEYWREQFFPEKKERSAQGEPQLPKGKKGHSSIHHRKNKDKQVDSPISIKRGSRCTKDVCDCKGDTGRGEGCSCAYDGNQPGIKDSQ